MQLTQHRDDPLLEVALPKGVLALKRGDGVDGVRPTDRALSGLGQAEEAHLPFAHQIRHGADHVLDGDRRVDAVLVEEIRVVRPQPG